MTREKLKAVFDKSPLLNLALYFAREVQLWDYDYGEAERCEYEHNIRIALLETMIEKENKIYTEAMKQKAEFTNDKRE